MTCPSHKIYWSVDARHVDGAELCTAILDAMIISAAPEDKEQNHCIYVAGFRRVLRPHKDRISDPFAVRLFTGILLDVLSNRQFVAVAGFVIKM